MAPDGFQKLFDMIMLPHLASSKSKIKKKREALIFLRTFRRMWLSLPNQIEIQKLMKMKLQFIFCLQKLGLFRFHTKCLICFVCVPIGCWEDLISEPYTSSCWPGEKQ